MKIQNQLYDLKLNINKITLDFSCVLGKGTKVPENSRTPTTEI